jgi:uncharacterized protein (DUF488 family)
MKTNHQARGARQMKIFTIGFTKKSAETFFTRLKDAKVKRLIDIRLHNSSQLAGFTKKDDLEFFTRAICNIEYLHLPELAPTEEILDTYKKAKKPDWQQYERQFNALIKSRHIEKTSREVIDGGCLLCSEETPEHCHRRLVAEYLQKHWPNVQIEHLP